MRYWRRWQPSRPCTTRPISTRSERGSTARSASFLAGVRAEMATLAPDALLPIDEVIRLVGAGGKRSAPGVLLLGLPGGGWRRRRADRASGRRARAAPHDGVDPRRPHGSEPGTARRPLQRDPADRAGAPAWLVGPRARRRTRSRCWPAISPRCSPTASCWSRGSRPDRLVGALDRYHRMRIGHGARAGLDVAGGDLEPATAAALQGRVLHGRGAAADRRGAGRRRRVRHRRRSPRTAAPLGSGVPAPGRRTRRRRDARAGPGRRSSSRKPEPALEARELDPVAVRALSALADLVAAG